MRYDFTGQLITGEHSCPAVQASAAAQREKNRELAVSPAQSELTKPSKPAKSDENDSSDDLLEAESKGSGASGRQQRGRNVQ